MESANFRTPRIYILENIVYLLKNFNKTKLPGNLFIQKFWGKFEEKTNWPINNPDTKGLTEKEPVLCLISDINLFLFLIILTDTDNFLSQTQGCKHGTEFCFFLNPLEYTVMRPVLFLPELFFKKVLNNLFIFKNLTRNSVFLNLWVWVIGLIVLVKILFNKH